MQAESGICDRQNAASESTGVSSCTDGCRSIRVIFLKRLDTAAWCLQIHPLMCIKIQRQEKKKFIYLIRIMIEYVSREFAEKEKVIKDREVASTSCPVCHLPAKRKIRWFMNNSSAYESVSFCQKHGYIKGKVRIRHTDEDAFYAIKTLKRMMKKKMRKKSVKNGIPSARKDRLNGSQRSSSERSRVW